MPSIYRHPDLPDYFEVRPAGESVVDAYEAGKVVVLDFRPGIDVDFWASLPTDADPTFKKFKLLGEECALNPKLQPTELTDRIAAQVRDLYRQVMPVYQAAFAPYRFLKKHAVCRLNVQRNLDLHFDTYPGEEYPHHFARMFINLDQQPRIWNTGWQIGEIMERWGGRIARADLERMTGGELWNELRRVSHGEGPADWWRGPPERHAAHFAPGDVWVVDSRQVAHQVVYGRRCLTIDFVVDKASMVDPRRHYLELVESFRDSRRAA